MWEPPRPPSTPKGHRAALFPLLLVLHAWPQPGPCQELSVAQRAVSQPEPWGAVLWFIGCSFQSSPARERAPQLGTAWQAGRARPRAPGGRRGLVLASSVPSRLTSPLTFSLEVAFGLGARQLEEEGEQQAEPAPGARRLLRSHGHGCRRAGLPRGPAELPFFSFSLSPLLLSLFSLSLSLSLCLFNALPLIPTRDIYKVQLYDPGHQLCPTGKVVKLIS